MKSNLARTLSLCLLAALSFTATCSGFPDAPSSSTNTDKRESGTSPRTVYVGSHLSEEQLLSLSALLRVKAPAAQLLLDSEPINHEQQRFLAAYHANEVVPIGSFPRGITDLENRLKCKMAPALCWQEDRPVSIWNALVPEANRVVVCPSKPRSLLLQSACLAGVLRAPLYINNGSDKERTELAHQIAQWRTKQVFAVAAARAFCNKLPGVSVVHLPDERMVAATCLRHLARHRPVRTLIVANPADTGSDKGGMSVLAPWIALHRHAALLLTNERGDNVNGLVESALRRPELERADTLLIVGSLKAIPMERRPNPIPGGKDPFIEMEPLTPRGTDVWSFATGRLFEADAGQLALRLARQELLRLESIDHHAVVVSNVGGGLPMLEAFSRNTIQELRNRGYQTSGLIGDVNKEDLRNELPNQDIFLWEGHHSTLVRDFGVPSWPEALSPALVVLQSCLALNEEEASPFLRRGGIGLIGSSTRVFSASGGGFALAFFDALLYDGQSVGGSLRQAKNFLLAYSLLKEKRLGQAAKLGAANVRTAWAFTLWGDPTLRLPLPPAPAKGLPVTRHRVHGHTIVLEIPETAYARAVTSKYSAQILPNGRLAGLVTKSPYDDTKQLCSLLFAEVHLPKAPPGKTPLLHSRLPGRRYVFCWDKRRATGFLLVLPRPQDHGELRFHIEWTPQETVQGQPSPTRQAVGTSQ